VVSQGIIFAQMLSSLH